MHHRFDFDGKASAVWLSRVGADYHLRIAEGWQGPVAWVQEQPGRGRLVIGNDSEPVAYAVDGDVIHIHCRGRAYTLQFVDPLIAYAMAGDEAGQNVARAPMPGTCVAVKVATGDAVVAGAVLMVIESMKLETAIRASQDGVVECIHVRQGDSFDRDAILVTLLQETA